MNYDIGNYLDYEPLLKDIEERFHRHSLLTISEHPIIGTYPDHTGKIEHGSESWFETTIIEMDEIAAKAGIVRKDDQLPCLNYRLCMAARDYAVTITPDGSLVRCPERFDESQITGNIKQGITDQKLVDSWKCVADFEKCRECVLFPKCVSVVNCLTSSLCLKYKKNIKEISSQAIWKYEHSSDK